MSDALERGRMTVYVKRLSITNILIIFMVVDMLLIFVTLCRRSSSTWSSAWASGA